MATEDDLEYYVTFPSPTPSPGNGDGEEGDEQPFDSSQREPVVILLGWAGCQDKHLANYSAIYEQRGYITIRYTAPSKDLFFNAPQKLRATSIKILELLFDLSLEENPIFFHVFSNGGGMLYQNITRVLHSDGQHSALQIRGVVYDSCPSHRSAVGAVKAFIASSPTRGIMTYLAALGLLLFIVVGAFFGYIKSFLYGEDQTDYWYRLFHDPARWPQLFLYSKADALISYRNVEQYIEHRKRQGIHVASVCWEETPHVQHMRYHRESYISQCYDFMDTCLNKYLDQ